MATQSAIEETKAYIAAELAKGGDPLGDDEDYDPNATDAVDAQAEPEQVEAAQVEETPAAQVEAAQVDAAAQVEAKAEEAPAKVETKPAPGILPVEPVVELPAYKVSARDYEAELDAFDAKCADIEMKWSEGAVSDEQRATSLAQIRGERDRVLIAFSSAQTIAEINTQNAKTAAARRVAAEEAAMQLTAAKALADGVDYAKDHEAVAQFDALFGAMRVLKKYAKATPLDVCADAHKAVLAMRGITPKAAEAKPEDKTPPARVPATPPTTLRGLPSAASTNSGATQADVLGRLKGADWQAAWSKLSPAQRAELLDD